MPEKKLLKYTHQINQRKPTQLSPSPIDRSLYAHNITLYNKLTKLGIPIIQTTPQTIKNLTNITKRTNNGTTSHAGYILHLNKHYIGETQCNLEKRIYDHKWSIETNDNQNALFSHMLKLKHAFSFSQAT